MYQVYLVDDDPMLLNDLRTGIQWLDNGFEVVGYAHSPEIALEEITKCQPDLVMADLKMEPFDGIELMQRLRDRGVTPYYLMVSAYGTFETSRNFFLEGGFDFLLKPVDPQEVQLALNRLYSVLSTRKAPPPSLKGCNPAFVDMMQYLELYYYKKHTLDSLGKQFGLSPNYICNLFSKHCDTTLVHHITDLRMAAAKDAIERGDAALKAIANQCGYNDYYYFCRVFKEYYGVSPGKYTAQEAPKGAVTQ